MTCSRTPRPALDDVHVVTFATAVIDDVRRRAQQGRDVYHKDAPSTGRAIADKILPSFPTCPIPDIKRLAQTPNQWRNEYLGYADIDGGRAGRGLLDRVQRDPAS